MPEATNVEQQQRPVDPRTRTSLQDLIAYGNDNLNAGLNSTETIDPYGKAKVSPYPAKTLGFDQVYNKTAYKRLGFNPYIDNIQKYGKESTNWEIFLDAQKAQTAMHNQMFNVFGLGGTDSSSSDSAEAYEELVAQGSPLGRDDTFAWAMKQYVQSGYTAAIISSIVVEELALAGATAITRGKTAELAWARTMENGRRLMHIADKMGDANKAKKVYDVTKLSGQAKSSLGHINDIQQISKMRAFWNKARTAGTKGVNTLFPHATGYMKAVKDGSYAMNGFASMNHAFGAYWREMREFKLAFDEAGLEKAFVHQTAMQELVEAYEAKHGKHPEGKDLEKLKEIARGAGDTTELLNSSLIYLSNKVGFGSLFNKFGKSIGRESIKASKHGKLISNKGNLKKGVLPSAEFVKAGLINQFKHYMKPANLKKAPLRSLKFMAGAAKMGTSEGLQEYFQEVIQEAETRRAVDSYTKAHDGSYLDYYGKAMDKYISAEGAEIFMSGFAMGAFAGPHKFITSKVADFGGHGIDFLAGDYKKNKADKKKVQAQYDKQVEKINDIFNKPWSKDIGFGNLMKSKKNNEASKALEESEEAQDEKEFRSVIDDTTLEVIYTALDNGTFDTLMDQLDQIDQLSDQEVYDAFKNEIGENTEEGINEFKQQAGKIKKQAEYIKSVKEQVDKDYVNPFSYAQTQELDDTSFGYNSHFLYNGYEHAKKQIIKHNYSYKRTLERLDSIARTFTSEPPFYNKTKMGAASDYTVLLNHQDMRQEISLLKKEAESLAQIPNNQITPNQALERKNKAEQLTHLSEIQLLLQELQKANMEASELEDGVFGESNEKNLEKLTEELGKSYDNYMRFLAKKNQTTAKLPDIQEGFKKLLDFHALKQDEINLSELTNMLMNPDHFQNTMLRKAATEQYIWENKKEIIAKSLEAFIKSAQTNKLLSILLEKYKAFMDEDSIADLQDDNKMPTQFYDSESHKPIDVNSKRHTEIVAEIVEYSLAKWTRSRPANSEYKKGTEIYPEDIVESKNKEVDKEVAKLNKANKKVTISKINKKNEDGTYEVVISLDGELEEVTLRPTLEAAPVEETETTTEEETVVTAPLKPINLNTPLAEWPEELVKEAEAARENYNQGIIQNPAFEGNEAAQKAAQHGTLETFITSQIGKINLTKILKAYNNKNNLTAVAEKTPVKKKGLGSSDEIEQKATWDKSEIKKWFEDPLRKEGRRADGVAAISLDPNKPIAHFGEESHKLTSIEEKQLWIEWKDALKAKNNTKQRRLEQALGESLANRLSRKAATVSLETLKAEGEESTDTTSEFLEQPDSELEPSSIYPQIESFLPEETEQAIMNGKVSIVTMALSGGPVEPIIAALRAERTIMPNEKLDNEKGGLTVKSEAINQTGEREITYTFRGRLRAMDVGTPFQIITMLNLPTKETETNKFPLEIAEQEGKIFYAESSDQQQWIQGKGRQNVFMVTSNLKPNDAPEAGYDEMRAYKKSIKDNFESSKLPGELTVKLHDVMEDNRKRAHTPGAAYLETADIQELYEAATKTIVKNLDITDFKVGDSYELQGKFRNFGVSMVAKVNKNSIRFKSIETGEETTIRVDALEALVSRQVPSVIEEIKKTPPVTAEQKETVKENKTVNNEITQEDIEKQFTENLNKSEEDVEDSFFDDATQDEENCN